MSVRSRRITGCCRAPPASSSLCLRGLSVTSWAASPSSSQRCLATSSLTSSSSSMLSGSLSLRKSTSIVLLSYCYFILSIFNYFKSRWSTCCWKASRTWRVAPPVSTWLPTPTWRTSPARRPGPGDSPSWTASWPSASALVSPSAPGSGKENQKEGETVFRYLCIGYVTSFVWCYLDIYCDAILLISTVPKPISPSV